MVQSGPLSGTPDDLLQPFRRGSAPWRGESGCDSRWRLVPAVIPVAAVSVSHVGLRAAMDASES